MLNQIASQLVGMLFIDMTTAEKNIVKILMVNKIVGLNNRGEVRWYEEAEG